MQKNPLGERRGASGGNWFPPGRRGSEPQATHAPQSMSAPCVPLFSPSFGWGTPHRPSVSGLCGERSRSGASEPTRRREGEGYAACGDEEMQEKYKHLGHPGRAQQRGPAGERRSGGISEHLPSGGWER